MGAALVVAMSRQWRRAFGFLYLVTKMFGYSTSKDRGLCGSGLCVALIWPGVVCLWLGVCSSAGVVVMAGYVALFYYDHAVMGWPSILVAVYVEAVPCYVRVCCTWSVASECCFLPFGTVIVGGVCSPDAVLPRSL